MKQSASNNSKISMILSKKGSLLLTFFAVSALFLTFLVAITSYSLFIKVSIFSFVLITYICVNIAFQKSQDDKVATVFEEVENHTPRHIFESDVEDKLLVLEEAGKFFGATLQTADMFRLLSSRIGEIIPFGTCVYYQEDTKNNFTVPFATGKNSRSFECVKINCGQGIAGKAYLSQKIEYDNNLELDRDLIEEDTFKELNSALAIPLLSENSSFGVLVLYAKESVGFDESSKVLAKAISERIMPLINSSIAFEKNLTNAMTDNLTNLPNERAFYLILENQVAEAQRFQEKRSLTILAIDIEGFSGINDKFGHSVGDIILAEVAERIKRQTRRMDFLARNINDEFLVVLPTATKEITEEVIKRIKLAFENKPIVIDDKENCSIKLKFGAATFQNDGETAEQLLKTALIRKQQTKSNRNSSLLFFPNHIKNY